MYICEYVRILDGDRDKCRNSDLSTSVYQGVAVWRNVLQCVAVPPRFLWRDSSMCVTRLIHTCSIYVCNMIHSYLWHNAIITNSCVLHDSLMCVARLIKLQSATCPQRMRVSYAGGRILHGENWSCEFYPANSFRLELLGLLQRVWFIWDFGISICVWVTNYCNLSRLCVN